MEWPLELQVARIEKFMSLLPSLQTQQLLWTMNGMVVNLLRNYANDRFILFRRTKIFFVAGKKYGDEIKYVMTNLLIRV